MRVSLGWLREWVSTSLSARELAERLTLGGLEAVSVTPAGPWLAVRQVVVGRIVSCEPQPGTRLKICEVDIGRRANLTIVCAADNAAVGISAPVALVGAKLPSGHEVQAKTIAGVESAGMLCSAEELGLEEHSDGIMRLDDDAPPGISVRKQLNLTDWVIELELTPNRGDCLSILGVAREVMVLTEAKKNGKWSIKKNLVRNRTRLPVKLRAPRACPHYAGRAVRGVDMAARTPDWMVERLRRSGVRSLNVVVDVTNYVMLELGQPMHAFDLDKLSGGIVVRMATRGEKLQLLGGSKVTLAADNLVIADQRKAVALAGIMGGLDTAISSATQHIYFESAFFQAAAIIGKARRFGMHTDASHRFERGVDPEIQVAALEYATGLLIKLAGGTPGPITDARAAKYMPRPVPITFAQNEILRFFGADMSTDNVRHLLRRLRMPVKPLASGKKGWKVIVPGWRPGITGPHDLAEEVGRVHGFNRISPRPPTATAITGREDERRISVDRVKQRFVERGYFEAITYSFVDPQLQHALLGKFGVKLRNPMADNQSAMRLSLWPGLLEAARGNINRQHERVRLFEVGHVFLQGRGASTVRREEHKIAALVTGAALPRQWGAAAREVDFFDLKGDLQALLALRASGDGSPQVTFSPAQHPALHPGRSAEIKLEKAGKSGKTTTDIIGHIGELHPTHRQVAGIDQPVYLFELDLSALAQAPLPEFSAISRYPAVRRDLAVVVDAEVGAQAVLDTARAAAEADDAEGLLVDLELFDIYAGEELGKNHKSFAFGLTFQSESRNLTASEVDAKTDRIVSALQDKCDAQLRA